MPLKSLIVAAALLFAVPALAQTQQNQGTPNQAQPQTPGAQQPNAQGEQPAAGRTMQEKDSGLMTQPGGAPGSTGSTGTQSGTKPSDGQK